MKSQKKKAFATTITTTKTIAKARYHLRKSRLCPYQKAQAPIFKFQNNNKSTKPRRTWGPFSGKRFWFPDRWSCVRRRGPRRGHAGAASLRRDSSPTSTDAPASWNDVVITRKKPRTQQAFLPPETKASREEESEINRNRRSFFVWRRS